LIDSESLKVDDDSHLFILGDTPMPYFLKEVTCEFIDKQIQMVKIGRLKQVG
jgi:hypothetical protein